MANNSGVDQYFSFCLCVMDVFAVIYFSANQCVLLGYYTLLSSVLCALLFCGFFSLF